MKLALIALLASNAFGSLVLVGPVDLTGTGFGTVTTVLTLQSPGNTKTETGCVAPSASGPDTVSCGFVNGAVMPGASHTATPTLASLGVTSALNLGIIFNADQPAGTGIVLDDLVLNLYASDLTKSQDFSSGPVTLAASSAGIGKTGYLFKLDTTQAQAAQAFIDAHGGTSGVSIGLGSSLSNATGGPETFFSTSVSALASVPEPGTASLLTIGLLGVGLVVAGKLRRG